MSKNRIFPTIDQIKEFRNPLTEGEFALLEYLEKYLPNTWEIYVQPYLNGDRPDIVILNPNAGMIFFEIKDWSSGLYYLKEEEFENTQSKELEKYKQYYVRTPKGDQKIPNPVNKVDRYREKLMGYYVPVIGENTDMNKKVLSAYKLAVYFHYLSTAEALDLVPVENKKCIVFGRDFLNEEHLFDIVKDANKNFSDFISEELADNIRRWLKPPFHAIEQNTNLRLTEEQTRHAQPAPGTHQRLRGVAGSGKSMVIAKRAANLAAQGKNVLIVTYNITLWHYLHDLISRARNGFEWSKIEFSHFHGFCRDYLLENDIPFPMSDEEDDDVILNEGLPLLVQEKKKSGKNQKQREYDAILIDEGQDFDKAWYDTLREFLSENDELLLVIDDRQNIYRKNGSWLDAMKNTKFRGRWGELKKSFRLPPQVIIKTNEFAARFLPNIGTDPIGETYQPEMFVPHMVWNEFSNEKNTQAAIEKVVEIVKFLKDEHNIHPQDIAILVPTHEEGWDLVERLKKISLNVNHVFENEEQTHRNKKSFWMGDGRIKASTIHSFKGWEIRNVIVLTSPTEYHNNDFMVYTALTRVRENLVVVNRSPRYTDYGKTWPPSW